MVSKLYFEETFSTGTAQALQEWANNNLIGQGVGDYGMKISYNANSTMFAETEITGLTIDSEYILSTETIEVSANIFKTKINALPNDNSSMVAELGYGTGKRTLLFTATAETMYIAIGDENGSINTYSIVDNVSLKIDGVEAVSNGTFEAGNTTGWYAQNGGATVAVYDYVIEPPTPGENPYLESVNILVYDSGNSAHVRIPTDEPYSEATFNNLSFTSFYIEPGDYTDVSLRNINITASGSSASRRYISLYNGNNEHPGKLPLDTTNLMNMSINMHGNYWIIDRMCAFNTNGVQSFIVQKGATYNIFNRTFTKNVRQSFWIRDRAHYNTIQYGRFDTMTLSGREDDLANVNILPYEDDTSILGTKVILCEFVDGQAFRCNRFPERPQDAYFDGTIFDSNTVEFTTAIRTDGSGNFDVNGDYAAAECAGVGLKSGSLDANNPVILSNNVVWGMRPSDPTYPKLSFKGVGFQAYMGSKYIHIKDNVIFDGTSGIKLADKYEKPYGTEYAEVDGNIILDCGDRPGSGGQTSLQIGQAYYADTRNNAVFNTIGYDAIAWYNFDGCYLGQNDFCNTEGDGILDENNNSPVSGLDTNTVYATATDGGYTEDFVFTKNKYTNSPETITLTNVVKP